MGDDLTPSVVFVADAGEGVGLGHLSRSSAVVAALEARAIQCHCLAYGVSEPLRRDGLTWTPLRDTEALPGMHSPVLVLDSYRIDAHALTRLASGRELVLMHDQGEPPSSTALIVSASRTPARPEPPNRLNGLAFVCLRPMFWGAPARHDRGRVQHILVSTGAGDPGGLSVGLAEAVASAMPEARVRLVQGPYAPSFDPDGVEVVRAPDALLDELLAADLVVSAAGQTMLEAAALGTPCVAVVLADNQRRQAQLLSDVGAVELFDRPDPASVAEAAAAIGDDADRRVALIRASQQAVDGFGALRVGFRVAQLARGTPR